MVELPDQLTVGVSEGSDLVERISIVRRGGVLGQVYVCGFGVARGVVGGPSNRRLVNAPRNIISHMGLYNY